jgi:cell division protein ZapA
MSSKHSQVEVTILGQGYVLACPEGGEALLRAAVATVDAEMIAIRNAGRVKARERIAVLAALNLAYRLAERRDTGAAAERPLPGVPAAGTGAGAGGAEHAAAQVDLDALLARVDTVLADDGQLL